MTVFLSSRARRSRTVLFWRLRPFFALCALAGSLAVGSAHAQGVAEADEALPKRIVAEADAVRFPQEGFQVDISISSITDQSSEIRKYRVLSKGNANTIIMTLSPIVDKGQILLMNERDLYMFLPEVSQPVRISLSQRLAGRVANGDLARANFSGDYAPKLVRTDTIEGKEYYVLELKAVDRSVTYQRVMYWVEKSNSRPFQAEFYSLSGKLLKTCKYQNYRELLGKPRPTRLVMEDGVRKGDLSVLEYSDMKLRDLPERVFTKEYLKRLQ